MARTSLFALAALLAVCPAPFSVAYPDGAPTTTCEHMTPGHGGYTAQNSSSLPYSIKVINDTSKYGDALAVQIAGVDYKGILMLVQEVNGTKPLGTWTDPPANTKLLQCSGIDGSAITHANREPKTSSTTYRWVPPVNYCQKTLMIKATVVKEFSTYWIGITYILHRDPAATCGSGGSSSPGSALDGSGSSNVNGSSNGSGSPGSPDIIGSTVGSSLNGSSSGSGVNGSSGDPWVTANSGDSDASVTSGALKITGNPTILLFLVVHMCLQLERLR